MSTLINTASRVDLTNLVGIPHNERQEVLLAGIMNNLAALVERLDVLLEKNNNIIKSI